ncbi:serpentine type 7TM GPCR chemoreceptor srd domain-containing protein [Ditylenchus destructor]|uniref:Serpentine type 7TM GPCR chemoreceptor srd domain-containing protein n=1 Tax=Ditylenchus destructor TaxID=166010 RepID=A0AAD4QSA2_9BILA|nr:serpentine type 7TM GPCR chemoreceptor srd domain-containing protein [Ditylenchus destructor]
MYNGQNVWVTNGVLRFLDQPYDFILIMWWFFAAAFSVISNCVPFIYRYLVICRHRVISPLSYAMMLMITLIFSVSFVSVSAWATFPDAEQQMEISNITMGLSNFLDQPVNMAPLKIGLIIKTENHKFAISSLYGMCLEIVCYTIIITCGVRIKRTIQAAMISEFYNTRLVEVNRQLNFVLLFQTMLPAFEIIPCAIYLVASVLADRSTNIYYMAFATISMHWVPVFSPLVTILVVKPYRNFVFCRNDRESAPLSSLTEKRSTNGITVTHITALG